MSPDETWLAATVPVLALTFLLLALGAALTVAVAPAGAWKGRGRRHHPARPGFLRSVLSPALTPALTSAEAWACAFVAGLVAFQVLLTALQAGGVDWSRTSMAAGAGLTVAAALALVAIRLPRGSSGGGDGGATAPAPAVGTPASAHLPWGAGLAGLLLAGFAAAVSTRWVTLPDFVYHWGMKGKRFHLANGVDYAFLTDPLDLTEHPDYPNLLPSLYAATAHVRGYFDELAMLAWSVVFVAVLLVLGRAVLRRWRAEHGLEAGPIEAGTAFFALVTVMFATGYHLAGGADLLITLGVVLALPALVRGRQASPAAAFDDLRVGLAAALVAAAKIEGVPLAALLVVARLWVVWSSSDRGRRPSAGWGRRLASLLAPPILVVVPWLVANWAHGIVRQENAGLPDPGRLGTVLGAVGEALATPEWYGFAWLLLLLPWLAAQRALRPAAALLAAQAAFYLYIYLSAVADPRFYVLSSLPRLLFHLVPPLLLLLWLRLMGGRPGGRLKGGGAVRRPATALAPVLAGLLLLPLLGCRGEVPDPGVVRYDDLATAWAGESGDKPMEAHRACDDFSPFSLPLDGGRELVLEVDLGQEPQLVLSYCRPGDVSGELVVRVEGRRPPAEGQAAVPALVERYLIDGAERWQQRVVDLAPLRGAGPDAAAAPPLPVRVTLRSTLPPGVELRLQEAYVRHRSPQAAGWPRGGVHVEGGPGAALPAGLEEPERGEADGEADDTVGEAAPRMADAGVPHVLLISLDTLRADVLDATGPDGQPLTPNLRRLAAEGQVFQPHYAGASWTKPSHATLLTGYPRTVHQLDGNEDELPSFVPTLAERMQAGGYATAGLVHNCVWLNPKFGFHRGFDDYRSVRWETGQLRRGAFNWIAHQVRAEPERPFFFFLHSFEAHSDFARLPYEAMGVDTGTVEERFGVARYGCREQHCSSGLLDAIHDGEVAALPEEPEILTYLYRAGVRETDAELGRLFDDLQELGVWDDLLLVVTSDHGEMLLEHGETLHGRVWDEVLQVPLIVKWPRRDGMPAPGRVAAPTSSIDVAATLTTLAGVEDETLPGLDLRRPRAERPIYTGSPFWHVVVERGYKMIQRNDETLLFHLTKDPREQNPLSEDPDDVLPHLRSLKRDLMAWSDATRARLQRIHGPDDGSPGATLTPEEEERLRALGYLR